MSRGKVAHKAIAGLVSVGITICAPLLVFVHRYTLWDWARLWNYHPPTEVAALATADTMTDYGKRLFYVHRPALESKEQFNGKCTTNESTIVLGCYISHRAIYVLDVTDPRLKGIKEVTSAHEMLHAAYDRLSDSEKATIKTYIDQTIPTINDKRILETIAAYQKRDAATAYNEIHSVIGTEVRTIPAGFEAYYSKYFITRSQVVDSSEQYEGVFEELDAQLKAIESKVNALKSEITALENSLNASAMQLEQQRAAVDRTNKASVDAYNQLVNAYNAKLPQLRAKIDQHNKLVEEYKTNLLARNTLVNEIDSRVKEIK